MAETSGRAIRIVVAVSVLALAAAGVGLLASRRGSTGGAAKYRTELVTRGDIAAVVTATGTLSAVTTVQVGSQVSGIISSLHADFNSAVTKGQLLAELDPTPFEAQVAQRRADLHRAQVQLQNAEVTFRRQERLSKALLIAEAELDAARAAYEISSAEVDQSRAALVQAETNLKYTKILSPIEGVVVARQYDVGQTVAASFSAPTLFTIAQDLTKMQVQADVDQSDIGRVAVDQRARFTVDAYPEQEFHGRISQIRLNATVNQTVITYPVIIEVGNPDEKLRPQMTANVTVEVAKARDVLRVANAALRFRPETPGKEQAPGSGAASPSGGRDRASRSSPAGGGSSPGAGTTTAGFERRPSEGPGGSSRAGASRRNAPLVYTLGPEGTLVPHTVKTGLSDGRLTEVEAADLHEGDPVVVGLATAKGSDATRQAPTLGGGGGGRGRF